MLSKLIFKRFRGFKVFLHWFGSFLETEITFSKLYGKTVLQFSTTL